jgi:hypothetical protein
MGNLPHKRKNILSLRDELSIIVEMLDPYSSWNFTHTCKQLYKRRSLLIKKIPLHERIDAIVWYLITNQDSKELTTEMELLISAEKEEWQQLISTLITIKGFQWNYFETDDLIKYHKRVRDLYTKHEHEEDIVLVTIAKYKDMALPLTIESGTNNVVIGYQTLTITTGSNNVAIGYQALTPLTTLPSLTTAGCATLTPLNANRPLAVYSSLYNIT